MLDSLNIVPLQVIAYGIGAAFVSELLSYVFMYRTSSFKRLKASFQTYEPVSSVAQGSTQSGNSKTAKKKEAKMKGFEAEVGRKMAVVQVVSGIMVGSEYLCVLLCAYNCLFSLFVWVLICMIKDQRNQFMYQIKMIAYCRLLQPW